MSLLATTANVKLFDMDKLEINQLDLFSGIGGFHLGFERAGYKVNSYFSEIDKHAVAVYKQQFKDSTYWPDRDWEKV